MSAGFLCGEIATKIKLPKVTGYILAGVLLNPDIVTAIPKNFINQTNAVTNIALSFVTFSIGGTLLFSRLKTLGKKILSITVFEAEAAFLAVTAGLCLCLPFLYGTQNSWLTFIFPLSLLLGCLASPTDPTSNLAVVHEYKAKGEVSSTILGVAAFDDALGIINYSLAIVVAHTLILHVKFDIFHSFIKPLIILGGSLLLGIVFGLFFNLISFLIKKETEGTLTVLIFALLPLCYGMATLLGLDELLSTMIMGIIVVNLNYKKDKIFKILERYTEQLIFVLFFTLSGMHLNFSVLKSSFFLIVIFILFRTIGKYVGTAWGASLSHASLKIRKYVPAGLIPQGGIVVGLALLIGQEPVFHSFSEVIVNVIIGATIFHELIGPVLVKASLKKAGEIH
ncbi:MAG: cation:proton antiporter [Candidatus Omnitrophota bacterium]